MTKPTRRRSTLPTPPVPPRQMSMALESTPLQGLSAPDRTKVLTHLALILMQATGTAAEEDSDER